MLCSKDTAKDTGLNVWVDGDLDGNGPEIDVIAVQGLGAHKYYTWVRKKSSAMQKENSKPFSGFGFIPIRRKIARTAESANTAESGDAALKEANNASTEVMWLRDLLPQFLPSARIATYSYKSDWRQDVKTNLRMCREQLLNVLYQCRLSEKELRRPLILVGHSLGGLVIKQALVLANHGEIFRDLRLSVTGIIFLGTPHRGSDAAGYGKWLARTAGCDTTLLDSLTSNSKILHEIAQDFETSYNNTDLVCFYEEKFGILGVKFVDFQSASLNGEDMYVRALAGYEKALGPEHTSTLSAVNNLGILYSDQGKLREAEDMYVRALAGYEKALGPEHTSALDIVNNLGLLFIDQGKLREAEDMYVRALAGYEKTLGPEHTSTLNTVNNLGNLYRGQGKLREAEDMYVRALAGYEKALGPEHTSTLDTVNNLGVLFIIQGKLREAEDLYVRALAGYEKALGPEHDKTIGARENLVKLKNILKSKTRRSISRLFKKTKT